MAIKITIILSDRKNPITLPTFFCGFTKESLMHIAIKQLHTFYNINDDSCTATIVCADTKNGKQTAILRNVNLSRKR